jgi:RimJ/RimL family protein N-acetyltransferase
VALCERGLCVVDGLGAARIAERLSATPVQALHVRPARAEDVYTYFEWANDPDVRRHSLSPEPIAFETHRNWFRAKLSAPDSHLLLLAAGDLPVGQIRFDREDDQLRIDYSVDPLFRGRGWGTHLVSLGMSALGERPPTVFRAEVKRDNSASAAVFLKLGFTETFSSAQPGMSLFRLSAAELRSAGGGQCG